MRVRAKPETVLLQSQKNGNLYHKGDRAQA